MPDIEVETIFKTQFTRTYCGDYCGEWKNIADELIKGADSKRFDTGSKMYDEALEKYHGNNEPDDPESDK